MLYYCEKLDFMAIFIDREDVLFEEMENLGVPGLYVEKFVKNYNLVVPNKVYKFLEEHIGNDYKRIHKDKETALDLCMMFLDLFSNTYYNVMFEGWLTLKSTYLRERVQHTATTYKDIIDSLTKPMGLKKKPLLEVRHSYSVGNYSKMYRLSEDFRCKGVQRYVVKSERARRVLENFRRRTLKRRVVNEIVVNQINLYSKLELPTEEHLFEVAKQRVKEGYRNSKGKLLVFKKDIEEKKLDPKKYSIVEDDIIRYIRITFGGEMFFPIVSEEAAGGRVTDVINLLPKWIRMELRIDGEEVVEVDYNCLHPNIALSLYGDGSKKNVNHDIIAKELNISRLEAKIEHLSFFNRPITSGRINGVYIRGMKDSPLWEYYASKELKMLEKVCREKAGQGYEYRKTTRRLFSKEVEIMHDCIKKFKVLDIHASYIYDAFLCKKSDYDKVKQVMDSVAYEHGINTEAG